VLSEQLTELDDRGQPPVKRVKYSTHQLQMRLPSLCEDRRDGTSPWPRLCEALVTAFDLQTEALLDHNVII